MTLYGDTRGLGTGPSLQEQHVSPVVGPPRDNMLIRSLNRPEPAFHRLTASSPEPGDDQSRRPPLWLQLTYFVAVVCFLLFFLIDRWDHRGGNDKAHDVGEMLRTDLICSSDVFLCSLTSQRLFKQLERLFQWVEVRAACLDGICPEHVYINLYVREPDAASCCGFSGPSMAWAPGFLWSRHPVRHHLCT